MGKLIDLTGQVFGKWTVVGRSKSSNKRGRRTWDCVCNCGKQASVDGANLIAKRSTKCRWCARKVHGLTSLDGPNHPLYDTWQAIRSRTCNSNAKDFPRYGGRGITLEPAWQDSPIAFVKWVEGNLGDKPSSEHQLDRIDNDGGYVPGNLKWSTRIEQANNTRTTETANIRKLQVKDLYDAGFGDRHIAEVIGVSEGAVARLRRSLGLQARCEKYPPIVRAKIELLYSQGNSYSEIARRTELSASGVHGYIKRTLCSASADVVNPVK